MKHYGDITKINGADVEPVSVICGGSPCQDLSVAGKRAGLAGARSGLFMDQIRIVKEMRENDKLHGGRTNEHVRPRYMVWENVAGAFTSNGGEDFRAVLEETAKIAAPDTIIPRPTDGKWAKAGYIMGDGWSICWRLHDAQFWGVPQRRKRICMVADFNGHTAPEIVFSPQFGRETADRETLEIIGDIRNEYRRKIQSFAESLPGHPQQEPKAREGIAGTIADCFGAAGEGGLFDIRISSDGTKNWRAHCYKTNISRALDTNGENPDSNHGGVAIVTAIDLYNGTMTGDICATVTAATGGTNTSGPKVIGRKPENGCQGKGWRENQSYKLNTIDTPAVCYGISGFESNGMKSANPHSGIYEAETARTLDLNGGSPACNQGGIAIVEKQKTYQQVAGTLSPGAHAGSYNGQDAYNDMFVTRSATVRRLTPLECERLQGYPDGWTDIGEWTDSKGKKHKDADSPRYKALGNSIALPFWRWMAARMVSELEKAGQEKTMASLFDGIGGFPLVYTECGCAPIWASEIEEFPIAVTKKHFPEGEAYREVPAAEEEVDE